MFAAADQLDARRPGSGGNLFWFGFGVLPLLLLLPVLHLQGVSHVLLSAGVFFVIGLLVAASVRSSVLAALVVVALAVGTEQLRIVVAGGSVSWADCAWTSAAAISAVAVAQVWRMSIRGGVLAGIVVVVGGAVAWFMYAPPGLAVGTATAEPTGLHYTVNHAKEFPSAVKVGFNMADVSSVASLDALPDGTHGVLWMRNGYSSTCVWQREDDSVVEIVKAARDHPKFSGIYFIADTPRPSNCPDAPEQIAARTALIHEHDPQGRTFIAVSGGYYYQEEFAQLADSADLLGVVVYPCNTKIGGCDMDKIDERVNRALDAGIPKSRLVPVIQAFGQECTIEQKNFYLAPTEDQLHQILARWDLLLPPETRPFDMTYSWGMQENQSCPSLEMLNGDEYPDLQTAFRNYFDEMGK